MLRPALVLALASLLALPGCKQKKHEDPDANPHVRGSGVGSVDTRTLPPFTRVAIGGTLDVTINVGKNGPLELRGEDNLIKLVPSKVEDGRLLLKPESSLKTTQPLRVTIATERLEALELTIGCRVTVHGLMADSLDVTLAGAARVTLEGSAAKLTLAARSASQADLTAFSAADATVSAADLARVRLGYTEKLDVTQKANALVTYRGTPDTTLHADRPSNVVAAK